MKRLELPRNKFFRLAINIIFVPIWYFLTEKLFLPIVSFLFFLPNGQTAIYMNDFFRNIYFLSMILVLLMPIIFLTRYIWFEKSRNKIFYGLFGKLKKIEPRIYTNTSNADELKKYADLRDQGIITEVEFQAKKKKFISRQF